MKEKSLRSIILFQAHSHLDTTLVRHFSADNPFEVDYEFKSKVIIDHDLSIKDAVLDLAHELVYYLSKKPFNPYEQLGKKDARDFVRDMIEGKGGEVEAFLMECAVMRPISRKVKVRISLSKSSSRQRVQGDVLACESNVLSTWKVQNFIFI